MKEYAKERRIGMREILWCVIHFCLAPTDNFKHSGVVNHLRTQGRQLRSLMHNLEKDSVNPSTAITRTLVSPYQRTDINGNSVMSQQRGRGPIGDEDTLEGDDSL